MASSPGPAEKPPGATGKPWPLPKLLRSLGRFTAATAVASACAVAAAPSLLSTTAGLNAALTLLNKSIPGTVSIQSASLSWLQPAVVEQLALQDKSGEVVLSINKISSGAPLWGIVAGRRGFGDVLFEGANADLRPDEESGLPRLTLALEPPEKALANRRKRARAPPNKRTATWHKGLPPEVIDVEMTVKAPGGGFSVRGAQALVEADVAAFVGAKAVFDLDMGPGAASPEDVVKAVTPPGGVPVPRGASWLPARASMWSECAHMEAVGAVDPKMKTMRLSQPIGLEMSLTPRVGQLLLSRVNPLLSAVVGPGEKEEDYPDVVAQISPENMTLPTQEYHFHLEPMRAAVSKGSLLDGVLSLVGQKGRDGRGQANPTIEIRTSAFETDVRVDRETSCSRVDILVGGVHVATWGSMDYENNTVNVTLGIPAMTLQRYFSLAGLPLDYCLLVPITGTPDIPKVEWKSATAQIAKLVIQRRVGIPSDLLGPDMKAPEPLGPLPWEAKALAKTR